MMIIVLVFHVLIMNNKDLIAYSRITSTDITKKYLINSEVNRDELDTVLSSSSLMSLSVGS